MCMKLTIVLDKNKTKIELYFRITLIQIYPILVSPIKVRLSLQVSFLITSNLSFNQNTEYR